MKEIRKMHSKVQLELDVISNRDAVNKARERDHSLITNLRLQLHRVEEQHRQLEAVTDKNKVLQENVELRNIIDDMKMGSDELLQHVELRESAAKGLELKQKELEDDLEMYQKRNVQVKAELELVKKELRNAAHREKHLTVELRDLKDKLAAAEGRIKHAEEASTSEKNPNAISVEYKPTTEELERVLKKLQKALDFERQGRIKAENEHFRHLQSRTALQTFLAEEIQEVRQRQVARKGTMKNSDRNKELDLDPVTRVTKAVVTATDLALMSREERDEALSRLFAKEDVLTILFDKAFPDPSAGL